MPSGVESSTVLTGGGWVVEPVDRFLAHLTAIDRSPNTVRAYAHDLRDYFQFLEYRELHWDQVVLEDLGRFITWLRLPVEARDGRVAMLPWVDPSLSAKSINRKLSALASFYEFHQRHGVGLGELLTRWRPGRRGGSWQPFLAHLGARPERHRTISLRAERRPPRELGQAEMTTLIDACGRLRDRFLLSLLRATGLRIGEALGLRHEDLDARRRLVVVRPRTNANGARAKTWSREIPADASVFRLYSDYLHEEYGLLDCDYVFVNLWGAPVGAPMTYASVDRLVRRLRARTGIMFSPHMFRHSYATGLLRRGVSPEIVAKLLGHSSISVTVDTYSHLGIEDARRALAAAGFLDPTTTEHTE
ncbi:site-specific integrase [Nocardia terpenica]|uniref:Tyrosine-type recombinase/integrase n=1 Tax=Nocardia terpenica TaxID=455432 RepID=A0A6G9ZDQ3_9NOCA|nr:site-specific integrase [Nocardia terpenica]QIS23370.1 tyrosine-type recombinase/integrase [Nocardia terpenica]QIS23574.1 tyrosine-type recombinase/integrase [Nocardia terpenica]